jgi:O-antigen/teichoic acid export membrane protein
MKTSNDFTVQLDPSQDRQARSALAKHFRLISKDTLIYGLGGALGSIMGIILAPILTRLFTPGDYGIIDIITTLNLLLNVFVIFGLDTAIQILFFKAPDEQKKQQTLDTAVQLSLSLACGIVLLLIVFRHPLSSLLLSQQGYANLLALSLISLPLALYTFFLQEILRLRFQPWRYTAISAIQIILLPAATITAVLLLRQKLFAYFIALLLVYAILALVSTFIARQNVFRSFSKQLVLPLLRLGMPLVPAGLAAWMMNFIGRYFLVHYSTLEQVGLYSIGFKIASALFLLIVAFRLAWTPYALSIENQPGALTVYAKACTYYSVLTMWAAVTIGLFSHELLVVFTTPAYHSAAGVVAPLALSIVAYGLLYIFSVGVNLAKRTDVILWSTLTAAVINIGLNVILIPKYGMYGATYATVIAYVISTALLFHLAQRYYRIPYDLRRLFGVLLSGIAILTLLWLCTPVLPFPILLIVKVVAALGFPFLLTSMGIITPLERKTILHELASLYALIRKRKVRNHI